MAETEEVVMAETIDKPHKACESTPVKGAFLLSLIHWLSGMGSLHLKNRDLVSFRSEILEF